MNLINIEKITKAYTDKKLFKEASFSLQDREKIGIIGINGTGKSTLLKMIAGLEEPDEGTITRASHIVVRYLPQHPEFDDEMSSIDCVLKGNITEENRWSIESDAKAMMTRLGITDFEQPAGQLSGGQRKRLALISVLLSPADVLLLDEPTNHLDNDMADWLEEQLKKWRNSLIMITHDRYFLDSVTNRIVEIDQGSTYSYETNYSGFLELKAQREEMELATERKRQSILRVELEWLKRGARARSTKQKAHIQRIEQLQEREAPTREGRVELSSISTRLGKTTVELEHISKSYEENCLIDDFSYIFLKNDRVGIVGKNGCGKSTLMKIIAGILPQDSGTVIVGQTVKMGYYAQEISSSKKSDVGKNEIDLSYMDPNQRVIDYVKEQAEYIQTTDGVLSASALLEKFLFSPEKQYSPIGKLSGGEKKRLNLLRVLSLSPNVILLDEPTNNLDIATLTILEDYLDRYQGIVVAVSHDRYFLDRTMRRIFSFEGEGKIKQYEGGYTDYILKKEEEEGEKTVQNKKTNSEPKIKKEKPRGSQKLKFTFKEQKEYEIIEDEIHKLEEKIEELDSEIMKNATNSFKLSELTQEQEKLQEALEEKVERWMYLEELAERIASQ